jgi:archaeal flagellar protein FlaJ
MKQKLKPINIHSIGYRFLGDAPSKLPLSDFVKTSLDRASIRMSYVVYMSSMAFWMIVSAALAGLVAIPTVYFLGPMLKLPIMYFYISLASPLLAAALVLICFIYYPISVADSKKMKLDKNMVYIINYMSVLAGAGIMTEDVFQSFANLKDTYGIRDSARSIVRDIGLLGKDIISAIEAEAKRTPSKKYSKLLNGLLGITKSGGDLKKYLEETAKHEQEVRRRELVDIVNKLNMAAEIYITLGITFPIILIVLLSLMGIFGGSIGGGFSPVQLMELMTYAIFPVAAIGIILLVDGMTQNW